MTLPTEDAAISAWLAERIGLLVELHPEAIDPSLPMEDLGLESSDAVVLMIELSELAGEPVSAAVLWEHPTIEGLASFLAAVGRGEAELPDDLLDLDFG